MTPADVCCWSPCVIGTAAFAPPWPTPVRRTASRLTVLRLPLITRDAMQRALQTVIRRAQYPTERSWGDGGPPSHRVNDDWDKMTNSGNVLSDDEWESELTEESAMMYRYNGPQSPPTPLERNPGDPLRERLLNGFRTAPYTGNDGTDPPVVSCGCVLFHTPHIPTPIVFMPPVDARGPPQNPIDWTRPSNTNQAESLMITECFWDSVEMKNTIDENRIVCFRGNEEPLGRLEAACNEPR